MNGSWFDNETGEVVSPTIKDGSVSVSGVEFTLDEFLTHYTPCELECGCQPGHKLCPTAERLWAKVNDAYAAHCANRSAESWDEYLSALGDYWRHFRVSPEAVIKRRTR